jgi:hypothetical protein
MIRSKRIELLPLKRELEGSEWIRRCRVRRLDGDQLIDEQHLWFQSDSSIEPPDDDDDDCDCYLIAFLMVAMREGRDLTVQGSVSKVLLGNLFEYQAIWNKWLPSKYSLVEMRASSVRTGETPALGAVCAFSGGVDATFSVWRHSQKQCGHRSQDIQRCSMIHGFDIALEDQFAFDHAYKTAARTLADIDLKLVPIRTNFREITLTEWGHVFGCAVVATLGNLKNAGGTGIVGSGPSYDVSQLSWGSTPVADHLLSSGGFHVLHDGASHNRSEKALAISEWNLGTASLRVCWQNAQGGRNCGKCEKCLRTQLNFLAVGAPIPASFPDPELNFKHLDDVAISKGVLPIEWQQLHDMAKRYHVRGAWVPRLRKVLRRNRRATSRRNFILGTVLPERTIRRRIVKYIAKSLGYRHWELLRSPKAVPPERGPGLP